MPALIVAAMVLIWITGSRSASLIQPTHIQGWRLSLSPQASDSTTCARRASIICTGLTTPVMDPVVPMMNSVMTALNVLTTENGFITPVMAWLGTQRAGKIELDQVRP